MVVALAEVTHTWQGKMYKTFSISVVDINQIAKVGNEVHSKGRSQATNMMIYAAALYDSKENFQEAAITIRKPTISSLVRP